MPDIVKFLATFVQSGNSGRQFFVKTPEIYDRKEKRKHEKFREIAGNSAPELPEFDGKSQKFRQFGVLTKFLSLF